MVRVEFFHTLTTGAKVFVSADVGEDVEITSVLSGNEPDAVLIPHELFSWKDRCGIYFAAQEVERQIARERKDQRA